MTRCAGSPLGVFQEEPGTRRGLLSTVLRGGGSLVTPGVGAPVAPAGAVATVVRRDKPGMQPVISTFVSLCTRLHPRRADRICLHDLVGHELTWWPSHARQ